jgi:hypothetical protein
LNTTRRLGHRRGDPAGGSARQYALGVSHHARQAALGNRCQLLSEDAGRQAAGLVSYGGALASMSSSTLPACANFTATKLRGPMHPARIALFLLALALSAADVAAAGPALAPERSGCHFSGTTINAGPGGRVFFRSTAEIDRIFLCSYRTGHRTRLGTDDCLNSIEVELTRFSRRFLAVDLLSCGPGGSVSTLDVRRTRDGRRIRRVRAVPAPPFMPGAFMRVTDLVLRGDGALAWIVEIRDTETASPRYQVRTSLRGTGSTLVAEGADIASGSLALGGSTLYWTQAGVPQSTSLGASLAAG